MSASIGNGFTPSLKIIAAAAGVGIVGGAVAERVLSPSSIGASAAGTQWRGELDKFLTQHPAPAGTGIYAGTKPSWTSFALLAGGSAVAAGAGVGIYKLASKMGASGNLPLATAGLALAALGVTSLVSSTASWTLR